MGAGRASTAAQAGLHFAVKVYSRQPQVLRPGGSITFSPRPARWQPGRGTLKIRGVR